MTNNGASDDEITGSEEEYIDSMWEYNPIHPEIYTFDEKFLDPVFLEAVNRARLFIRGRRSSNNSNSNSTSTPLTDESEESIVVSSLSSLSSASSTSSSSPDSSSNNNETNNNIRRRNNNSSSNNSNNSSSSSNSSTSSSSSSLLPKKSSAEQGRRDDNTIVIENEEVLPADWLFNSGSNYFNQCDLKNNEILRSLLKYECKGIFSLPIFTLEYCRLLLEEVENFEKSKLKQYRPNTMNNYGVILGEMGLSDFFDEFVFHYMRPLARLLHRNEEEDYYNSVPTTPTTPKSNKRSNEFDNIFEIKPRRRPAIVCCSCCNNTYVSFEGDNVEEYGAYNDDDDDDGEDEDDHHLTEVIDDHHSFVVEYGMDKDLGLDFHTDDSELTINLCLGKSFKGGNIYFRGLRNDPTTYNEYDEYSHEVGRAIIHDGTHRHGALPIVSGERFNLIIWMRSGPYRERQKHKERLRQKLRDEHGSKKHKKQKH